MNSNPARGLPAVHALLEHPSLRDAIAASGRVPVLDAVRATLDAARVALRSGEPSPLGVEDLAGLVRERLRDRGASLRPVINATGVLLHTGLGRAPLAAEAIDAIARVAAGYCNLEFHLDSGDRGRRADAVAACLQRLTGAEAATVVNNNAAATVLALRALAGGREVIVSRGELVEIGGSFRLPEIFEVAGVRLREVGTTNKTRLADYRQAIGPQTGALLRVHASNYRIVGFTERPEVADMVALAQEAGLPLIDDIGSGALAPGLPPCPPDEPTIADSLRAGSHVVLCSGDKLLGGPQCGLILGGRDWIGRIATDPLMRAFRVDKLTLAALETTLRLALDPVTAAARIPLWASLNRTEAELRDRADRLAGRLRDDLGLDARVESSTAFLGGGSVPAEAIPSVAVRLVPPYAESIASEAELARRLRAAEPAIVPRLQGGGLLLDLRALTEAEDAVLATVLARIVRPGRSGEEQPPIAATGPPG